MKKFIILTMIFFVALTMTGCDSLFADFRLDETLSASDINATKPVTTANSKAFYIDILIKEDWFNTVTPTTLKFDKDGTGIGTTLNNDRTVIEYQYSFTWEAMDDGQISLKFSYLPNNSYFYLEVIDGIWHLESVKSSSFYVYKSEFNQVSDVSIQQGEDS